MIEDLLYKTFLKNTHGRYEAQCKRCGACCGVYDGDPCARLQYDSRTKTYFCNDYKHRLGSQMTMQGKSFVCVPIRQRVEQDTLPHNCAYHSSASSQTS